MTNLTRRAVFAGPLAMPLLMAPAAAPNMNTVWDAVLAEFRRADRAYGEAAVALDEAEFALRDRLPPRPKSMFYYDDETMMTEPLENIRSDLMQWNKHCNLSFNEKENKIDAEISKLAQWRIDFVEMRRSLVILKERCDAASEVEDAALERLLATRPPTLKALREKMEALNERFGMEGHQRQLIADLEWLEHSESPARQRVADISMIGAGI